MGIKKTFQWAITFAVLISFTVYAIGNITGHSQRVALAKVVEEDPSLQGGVLVLAAEDELSPLELRRLEREEERELRRLEREADRIAREEAREQRAFERFLRRFQRYYDRQLICVLTDDQEQAVALLYDTSIETLPLNDGDVDVLTVEGEELRASDLRRIVGSSGGDAEGNLHCRTLEHKNIFYTLFTGSVS